MRKFLISVFCILSSAFCIPTKADYTITGTVEGAMDGDSVLLCSMQGFFTFIPEDTAVIKNHQFQFKGHVDGAALRSIMPYHGAEPYNSAMVILENAPISVEIYADSIRQPKVTGGPTAALFKEFETNSNAIYEGTEPLFAIANDSTQPEDKRQAAASKIQAAEDKAHHYVYNFVMSHIPSPVSDMLLTYTEFTPEEMDTILKMMAAAPVQYGTYKALMEEKARLAATAVGTRYTDIVLQGTDGKTVRVSDYVSKNRYTLIDFWASWCGPCRREMPNVCKAYELYHQKGFEVVGVSLDNNKNAWVRALDQLHMPWPQMSDLKGWESEGAKAYNVKAIPANALVDQNGIIIARDLREQDLQTKLAELFSK